MNPLVSIIIPTYNRPFLLEATLGSVLEQEYGGWECLVIDDGSNKETINHVQDFCLRDSRIKFFKRPDEFRKGASACRNYGLSQAQGELIQFLDDDDLLDKEKLAEQVKFYSKNHQFTLFTSKWGGFTDSDDLKSRFKFKYHSYRNFQKGAELLRTFGLYNEYFPVHVYLTPQPLIKKAGLWDEELSNNDDAEFFTRVILKAHKIIFSSNAKVHYRYNTSDNLSLLDSEAKNQSVIKSWILIKSHITQAGSMGAERYYLRAKDNLYKFFSVKSPDVIAENRCFFKERPIVFKLFDNLKITISKFQKKYSR